MRLAAEDNRPPPAPTADDRLVFFEYCISLIFFSLRRPSAPVRLRPGRRSWTKRLPYTILTLLLGWWCLPWGLVYTPLVLWTNLTGGRRITAAEIEQWGDMGAGGVTR